MRIILKNKKITFLFYIIQVISSLILIFPLLFNNLNLINIYSFLYLNYYFSLILKLGIPPFHL